MNEPETLDLIVVSYNTRELLRQCLDSVGRHAPEARAIVVDNASRDGSPEMVRDEFPAVELVSTGWNAGFAAANNAGLERSRAEFVVLLNSDTVLSDDSLQRCARWMRARPEVGASSPRLIGADDRPQQCLYPLPRFSAIVREALRLPASPPRPNDEGWLAGTALVLRRAALESIGGRLDAAYWMYWEDCDLSARLRAAGWRLEPFEGGSIRHYGGASGGGADESRRADLHAWYVFGRHRWFAAHRPGAEAAGLWLLDMLDVARMGLRGAVHPNRRVAWAQAGVTARVLWDRLFGRRPAYPGGPRPGEGAVLKTATSPPPARRTSLRT